MIHVGDCREVMATLDADSFDAIVTDPPYGLEFMGKEWDKLGGGRTSKPGIGERSTEWPNSRGWNERRCKNCGHLSHGGSPCSCNAPSFACADDRWAKMQAWHFDWAVAALRIAKPGAHLVAFGGTRTFHRLACAIEDAGWEIRDTLSWLYGQGFPKSLDVSKAIDKAAGAERNRVPATGGIGRGDDATMPCAEAITDTARQWQGWGTALKPAWEPILLARKPLAGTVAANVQRYGTGALNVDGCRIETEGGSPAAEFRRRAADAGRLPGVQGEDRTAAAAQARGKIRDRSSLEAYTAERPGEVIGRWPANVCLDEAAAAALDEQSGERKSGSRAEGAYRSAGANCFGEYDANERPEIVGSSGGASRFFFTAKASNADRGTHTKGALPLFGIPEEHVRNHHPTVKPTELMRWLVRLVTPPGGLVLDPFLGSGTTAVAAQIEGFRWVGIEQDAGYAEIARKRLEAALLRPR